MGMPPNEDVTCLLQRLNAGEEGGLDRLMEAVYGDLRAMAQRHRTDDSGFDGLPSPE